MARLGTYNKYDLLLWSLGLVIVLMFGASLVSMTATMLVGLVGASLVGHALFIVPPTDEDGPKDLSTRSA